ncbi:MAG: prepilin-type N-terminal cleavage/methylation domain-containing protein [Gemmatimonadetes bacterium]|nr:prepilin-type N-terminal cleavage/methylation domain-containing protein [Gemmatimonadota bacterium]
MRRAGFTLLEAAVSLAIVGVVAIGALDAYAAEARAALRARQTAPAAALAAERLARLQLLDARQLRALPDSVRSGAMTTGPWRYDWRAAVARVADEPDLYTLEVVVEWEGGSYALASRAYRPAQAVFP